MPRIRPKSDRWAHTPNELRTAKNHMVTLTDKAWTALTELAKRTEKNSKSAVLERLILAEFAAQKKSTRDT